MDRTANDFMGNPMAEEWHLDKKVPISLIGAIILQTFAVGIWTESLNSRISDLERITPQTLAEFTKLETARETTNLTLNDVQHDVKSLLELSRRNETRNVRQDRDHDDPDRQNTPH